MNTIEIAVFRNMKSAESFALTIFETSANDVYIKPKRGEKEYEGEDIIYWAVHVGQ